MSQNSKLYYIIPGAVLVIVILLVLLIPKKNNQVQPTVTPTIALPTALPTETRTSPSVTTKPGIKITVTPTLVPANFTGVVEEQQIPQAETDLAVQKSALRKKLPLAQPTFTITFDYADDQFVVTLSEPKDTSKNQFNQWLQGNYPKIPIDRFSFK